jgi:hypothetical protein
MICAGGRGNGDTDVPDSRKKAASPARPAARPGGLERKTPCFAMHPVCCPCTKKEPGCLFPIPAARPSTFPSIFRGLLLTGTRGCQLPIPVSRSQLHRAHSAPIRGPERRARREVHSTISALPAVEAWRVMPSSHITTGPSPPRAGSVVLSRASNRYAADTLTEVSIHRHETHRIRRKRDWADRQP